MSKLPLGISVIEKSCCTSNNIVTKKRGYNAFIWVLTYLVYMSYHLSRKPISVVKGELNKNCTGLDKDHVHNDTYWCDWAPFNKDNSQFLLGKIDSCFLFAYAIGMFFCGIIAERMDLRHFITFGMISSGIFTLSFGLGHTFNIHGLWFYILSMVLNGLVQATGWPSVIAVMGNWFGKSKRGLIMGVWNSHTSVGNIVGTLIASAFVDKNWTFSFVVPGIFIICVGIIVFFFLVPQPSYVKLPNPNDFKDASLLPPNSSLSYHQDEATPDETDHLLDHEELSTSSYGAGEKSMNDLSADGVPIVKMETASHENDHAISFVGALKIPGVIEFSLCLFFAKLVSYTFLYWLPNYLFHETTYDEKDSANLSTLYDVGGVIGGIAAGIISDTSHKPASTCAIMLIFAIPMMFIYNSYGTVSLGLNIFLLMLTGVLVNGPYSLITTAVSAELGTHESLKGNSKALATVSSIIDGTGSIGAAVGPLLAGVISDHSWDYVFYMLMGADVIALLLLTRLVFHEIQSYIRR